MCYGYCANLENDGQNCGLERRVVVDLMNDLGNREWCGNKCFEECKGNVLCNFGMCDYAN